MKSFIAYSVGCLLVVLLMIAIAAFEGLILSLLWNWLAPIFWPSAPILTIWQAFGIFAFINILLSAFNRIHD